MDRLFTHDINGVLLPPKMKVELTGTERTANPHHSVFVIIIISLSIDTCQLRKDQRLHLTIKLGHR